MNISKEDPWTSYWNKGGFLKTGLPEPTRPSDAALQAALMGGGAATSAALRKPGVTGPTVQQGMVDMDREFKRRKAGPRPQGFDMGGAMKELGGPPQRPPLPDRPGPDRSAGSVIAQMLAGASDVAGAAGGMRTNNLARMQEISRQQADVQYGDALRKQEAAFGNDVGKYQHGLRSIGMRSDAANREQGQWSADQYLRMAEDNALQRDMMEEMDRQRREREGAAIIENNRRKLQIEAELKAAEAAENQANRDRDYGLQREKFDFYKQTFPMRYGGRGGAASPQEEAAEEAAEATLLKQDFDTNATTPELLDAWTARKISDVKSDKDLSYTAKLERIETLNAMHAQRVAEWQKRDYDAAVGPNKAAFEELQKRMKSAADISEQFHGTRTLSPEALKLIRIHADDDARGYAPWR